MKETHIDIYPLIDEIKRTEDRQAVYRDIATRLMTAWSCDTYDEGQKGEWRVLGGLLEIIKGTWGPASYDVSYPLSHDGKLPTETEESKSS